MPKNISPLLLLAIVATLETSRATTVSLIPVADNYAQDANVDGVFDVLATRTGHTSCSAVPSPRVRCRGLRRETCAPAWSLISPTFPKVPPSFPRSSRFTAPELTPSATPDPYLGMSVSGYAGDGVITLSDFNNLNVVTNAPEFDFNVRSFIQSLVNAGEDYAGLVVGSNTLGYGRDMYSRDHAADAGPTPTLVIQYTVPEASSFAIFSLAGVTWLLRRKRWGS